MFLSVIWSHSNVTFFSLLANDTSIVYTFSDVTNIKVVRYLIIQILLYNDIKIRNEYTWDKAVEITKQGLTNT